MSETDWKDRLPTEDRSGTSLCTCRKDECLITQMEERIFILESKLRSAEEKLARRTEEVEKLKALIRLAVGWMEPMMDGFSVPDKQKNGEPSCRVVVLN